MWINFWTDIGRNPLPKRISICCLQYILCMMHCLVTLLGPYTFLKTIQEITCWVHEVASPRLASHMHWVSEEGNEVTLRWQKRSPTQDMYLDEVIFLVTLPIQIENPPGRTFITVNYMDSVCHSLKGCLIHWHRVHTFITEKEKERWRLENYIGRWTNTGLAQTRNCNLLK